MRVSWASQEERRDGSVLCGQSMKDKTWCHRGGASLELWTMSTGNCFGLKRKLIRNSPGLCLLQKVRLAGIYQEDEQWERQGQPGTRQESGQPGPERGAPSSQEDRTGQPSSGWLSWCCQEDQKKERKKEKASEKRRH